MDLRTVLTRTLGALALCLALGAGAILVTTGTIAPTSASSQPSASSQLSPSEGSATAETTATEIVVGKPKIKRMLWRPTVPVARTPVNPPPRPTRHLILIPGGGFTFLDTSFWPVVSPAATAAGFVPHLLKYRLFDLKGAVDDARALADQLSMRYGRSNVFAYGSSAGGTLATLLAAEGRVAAAAVSSALFDLRDWPWAVIEKRGPEYLEKIGASWEVRRELSPIRHRLRCPLLSLHGTRDTIVSVFQAEDYVATHPRARLRLFPAGHGLYRSRPASVTAAFRWLNRIGNKQARIERNPLLQGARAAKAVRRIRCV